MSTPKDFVSRWSRLKREANSARHVRPEAMGAREVSAEPKTAPGSVRGNDAAAIEPFDLEKLPPIDAITSDTDIHAFLRSQVSADLTRAALRRAWTSDPAIRDFIGIAEGQWDFNAPNTIAGFGPLRATDNAVALLEQAIGGCKRAAGTVAELADLDRSEQGNSADCECDAGPRELPEDHRESVASKDNSVRDGDVFTARRHGSASPR